jgi:endonuclease III
MADGPRAYYEKAMAFAREFYGEEVERISSVRLESVTPAFFFQEYVWVVHATGFSAKAVGKFMPRLMAAYGKWDRLGREKFAPAMARVKAVCNNPQKAKAVHSTASRMVAELRDTPWEEWRRENLSSVEKIGELPYVGKITRYHLGRNVGLLDCVKPDLHLVRMADHWGFKDCESMCLAMRGDDEVPLGIVDLAVWYAAATFGTIGIKQDGKR